MTSTIIGMDGFDMYNGTGTGTGLASKWTVSGSPISMVAGRFGGQCVRVNSNGSTSRPSAQRLFTPTGANFSVGWAWQFSGLGATTGKYAICIGYDTTNHLALCINLSGQLLLYRGSAATLLSTSVSPWVIANNWIFVEMSGVIDPVSGSCDVHVDGNLALSFSGQTQNGGTAGINKFITDTDLNGGTAANDNVNMDVDDVYLNNSSTRLGGSRIETLYGIADVAANWTPNSGANNYSRINETLVDGDTSYVESGVVGTQDLYDLGNLSTAPSQIHAMQVVCFPRKTDAGDRGINATVKSGATTSQGSDILLSPSYARYERILVTDPNTSLAWTAAGINAVQIGPRIAV